MPTLERLIAGPHEVVGVVSQPDRRRGRGKKLSPSPVAEVALREELPMLRPERVGEPDSVEALRALEPDLGVVVAFGQFLPKSVRELPSLGYLINAVTGLSGVMLNMAGAAAKELSTLVLAMLAALGGSLWVGPEFGAAGLACVFSSSIALKNIASYALARHHLLTMRETS